MEQTRLCHLFSSNCSFYSFLKLATFVFLSAFALDVSASNSNNRSDTSPLDCDNVTEGGIISGNQTLCLPTDADPAPIVSDLLPQGGTGSLQYLWLQSTVPDYTPGDPNWSVVPNSNSPTYDPPYLTQTTYYIRCARRSGCDNYVAESNIVVINVSVAPIIQDVMSYDATCFGYSNGSISVSAFGGTGTLSYDWTGGLPPVANPAGIPAGTYTLTVSDIYGCAVTTTVTINQPAEFTVDITSTNPSCFDTTDGSAFLTVNAENPYTILWSTGNTSASMSNLAPGQYSVTLTDSNDCTATAQTVITAPQSPLSNVVVSNITCNGLDNGSATALVPGNIPPYSYAWGSGSGTSFSSTINNLVPGTYTVTVTDGNGCTDSEAISILEPDALEITSEVYTDASCSGLADGQASLTIAGGTAPFVFNWSDGQHGSSVNLGAGDYEVTVYDGFSCSVTTSFTINSPDLLVADGGDPAMLACFGDSDGTSTATASGGTPPYTYQWTNGQTSSTATGLDAGNYTVTITDAHDCSATATITVLQPTLLEIQASSTDAHCNQEASGTGSASASGGSPAYTYLWSNNATTADVSGLMPGDYSVTVTDNSGCSQTTSITIGEPTALTISASGTDASCYQMPDGTGTVSAAGGTPGYTYTWSNGDTGEDISGLVGGTYGVTVSDANDCTASTTIIINEPTEIIATISSGDVLCNGGTTGSAIVSPSGGTPGYTYEWSTGATSEDITDLAEGTYTVTITDAAGCTTEASAIIGQHDAITIADISGTDPLCTNDANGSASAEAAGGTGIYTYAWSNGGSGNTISGLTAGDYTVTATDSNGCSVTATITLNDPEELTISATATDAICFSSNEGTASASAAGGRPPYSFAWSNGMSGTDISDLTAGDYTVVVTDANGCSTETTVTVGQPTVLTIDVDGTDAACIGSNSGSAIATAGGGTGPYTYLWSDGQTTATASNLAAGNYNVVATDTNNCSISGNVTILNSYEVTAFLDGQNPSCNGYSDGIVIANPSNGVEPYSYAWSNGATGNTVYNLSAGDYSATVTDANGCSHVAQVTLSEPAPLAISVDGFNIQCAGGTGSATANVSGGSAPYSYAWSNGSTGQTNGDLGTGNYSVTATDSNGCSITGEVGITEPFPVTVDITAVDVLCNGEATGMAYATPGGGTPPYTYLWSNDETGQNLLSQLAGNYSVTVTDANGCAGSGNVVIGQPEALTGSLSTTDAGCDGASGTATANVSGGVGPYQYSWSTGETGPGNTITSLPGGNVSVWVTDANGCNTQLSGFINSTAPLSITATASDVSCNGYSDGSTSVVATGGSGSYTYLWSNGQTTATIGGLVAGNYSVTVTDSNGCAAFGGAFVNEPAPLGVNMSGDDISCNGQSNGNAYAMPVGGTPPYSFAWNNGSTQQNLIGVGAGTYNVTMTDANNCQAFGSVTLSQPALLTAALNSNNPTCGGIAGGSAVIIPSGGTGNYTYLWNTGATTAAITGLDAGFYAVTVTDENNCYFQASTTLFAPAELELTMSATDVTCAGSSDGTATANVSGGVGPYTYEWNNNDQSVTSTITGLGAQRYNVTITDANGCQVSDGIYVYEPSQLVATVSSESGCQGGVLGYASVAPTGGTFPYTYLWSTGENTPVIYNADGTVTVTVTDANGCTVTENVTVNNNPAINLNLPSTDITCNGYSNGSALVQPSGGSGNFSYSWNTGSTEAGTYGLSVGSYSVTVTDAAGCQAYGSVYITEPNPVSVSAYAEDASCNNAADGSAFAQGSGGTPPYAFSWSNGATGASIYNLAAGAYYVTVADANGCEAVTAVNVGQPVSLTVTTSGSDATCSSNSSGSASAFVGGGSGTYSYTWSNGAIGATISNLTSGTYSVTVTDTNGCTGVSSVTIGNSAEVTVSVQGTDANCGAANGTANAIPSGGNGDYTSYNWSNGATGNYVSGLAAGTYTVTVSDSNGCSATGSVTLGTSLAVTVSIDATDVSCIGAGSATANAGAGTAPYSYAWSNGSTGQSITDLVAGSYNVTVTDALGCQAYGTATIGGSLAPQLSETHTDISCNGANDGSISVAATGAGPFQYEWNDGQTTAAISGLSAGTYSVTVMDANGCTASLTVSIDENSGISLSTNTADATCFDSNDGSASVSASGGSAPYTYAWNNGATTSATSQLAAGIYSVTVTDAGGCTASTSVNINAPSELLVSGTVTSANCSAVADGSIDLVISGGNAPYTTLWNTGDTAASLSGLAPGLYTVTVTDNNNCEVSMSFDVSGGNAVAGTISTNDPTDLCVGDGTPDLIDVTASGASAQNTAWVITDDAGNILELPVSPPFDFDGAPAGTCLIWYLAYDGSISGLTVGSSANDLSGCFDLSDPITVTRNQADGGTIATNDPTEICAGDGIADPINVTLDGAVGSSQWVITNEAGTILGLPAGPPFDLDGAGEGVCLIWHLSYDGAISGATVGNNAADITGCYSLSNAITVTRTTANGGTISTNDPTVVCAGDDIDDLINVTLTGNLGDNSQWVITDVQGNILDLPAGSPFNFSGAPAGVCLIWHASYADGFSGLAIGANTNSIEGCFALSNPITITRNNPDGGTISTTDPTEICAGDGLANPINVTLDGETGDFSAWVITDSDGNILALPAGSPFDLEGAGAGVCLIWHLSWDGNISGATVGQNAADITGCYDLSNPIAVTRTDENHIGDYVWNDVNANCIQDDNEYGVSGVDVRLIQAGNDGLYCTEDDIIVETTTTNNAGYYAFGCVAPGEYSVLFTDIPSGYEFTCANTGGDDSIDSDADATTGKTDPFTVDDTGDFTNFDLDAGIIALCNNLTDGGTIAQSQTICLGNVPNLLASTLEPVGGGGSEIEYLWMTTTTPGPFSADLWDSIPGATEADYQPANIYQTTYFVRCSRREGCPNYVESNIIAISTVSIPTATINLPSEICAGEPYHISASNAGAGVSYSWSFGGASPSSGNQQEILNVTWNSPGEKTITLTVTRGTCSHTESMTIEVVEDCGTIPFTDGFIDFNARLMASYDNDIMLDWSTIELNQYEYFVEYSEDGNLFTTATQVSGKNASAVNNYDFMLENNPAGIVYLRVRRIAPDGTSIYSEIRQVVVNPANAEIFAVYPNPVYKEVNVKLLEPLTQDATLQIFTTDGKMVRTMQISKDMIMETINVSKYPVGMYILRITSDEIGSKA